MLVLTVTWLANEGRENDFIAECRKLATAARQEPGCRMFVVHQHRDDKRRFFIYEEYNNDAALQAHRDSDHFKEIARGTLPTMGERVEAHLMEPLA